MLEILPFAPARDARYFPEQDSRHKPVLITGDTGERLRTDAVDALRSLPRRGLEIGGVLLGAAEESITVRDLVPVESEHLYGPRYELSDRDRVEFLERISQLRESAADIPVGIYRTFTIEGGGVDARDEDALRQYFPDRNGLFVLAFPRLNGRAEVSCFYWDQQSLTPCPLIAGPPIVKALEAVKPPQDAPLPSRREAEPHVKKARQPRAERVQWINEIVLAAMGGLIVFAAVALMHSNSVASSTGRADPQAVSNQLGARLEFTSKGAQLVWDGTSEAIRKSVGALLSVRDGANIVELPITASELQTGNFFYGAADPQAAFELIVFSPEGSEVRETVSAHPRATLMRRPAKATRDRAREKYAEPARENVQRPQSWNLPPPVTSGSGSILPHD